ncbi:MAG: ABC transporter ATP-binding protein [Deltaproteobacteria bacterium]|nr:ABC transporter ATP-binding protein [Deltaproteobacteria bacterium]
MSAVPERIIATPAGDDAVLLQNVSFSRDRETVLENVNLRVAPGDFLAILGPNGGGKTTLLRIILGLLKPNTGTVRIFGKEPGNARSHIGYVPQFSTIRQAFPATVLDMTLMGAAGLATRGPVGRRSLWSRTGPAREKAMRILDLLGIAELANNPVHALSGGQRQRLLLARALMGRDDDEPFLLLLDEPTASIDPEGKGCFLEFCDSLRNDVTMVMVSHELGMASPFFSGVALVNKTLTLVDGNCPSSETLRSFIGVHAPDCPVSRMIRHSPGCGCHEPGEKA